MRPQRILRCTACHHGSAACSPGIDFLARLGAAIALAPVGAEFELVGSASLICNGQVCPAVWRATADATWLWGDVAPDVPIAALLDTGEGDCVIAAAEIMTGAVVVQ
ncbi:hypothetical protein [Rhodobacter viridis]|nr:hypothetical protein [Rhodobacter viridis]